MQKIKQFLSDLSAPAKIVITTHMNPDADALGSSLGLCMILRNRGLDVVVVTPNDFPEFLKWMPQSNEVIIYEQTAELAQDKISQAQVICCLDFSDLKRVGELGVHVSNSPATKILIDHHRDPEKFASYCLWSTEAGATAELVFDLIAGLSWLDLIDESVANCLYAGIMTDTGGFRHPNTTQHIHEIVAKLIGMGANISLVSKFIYDTNSVDRLRLTGFSLLDRLVVLPEYNVAYIYLSQEDMRRFHVQTGDTEGLVNYALSIKDVTMAAIFKERRDMVKISFRSIGDFSVNDFARKNFDGGGHINAAGGISQFSLSDTIKKFEELLPKYKNELLSTQHA